MDIGARTNYTKTIEDIYNAGLKEDSKICFYDDISIRPESLIDEIYNFIELDNTELKNDEEYVKSLSKKVYSTENKREIPHELEIRLKAYFEPMVKELINKYELDLPSSWYSYYDLTKG